MGSRAAQVGRYRVVRRLAIGGMGEVFLAENPDERQRPVVVKTLREPDDGAQRLMFLDEARIASSLVHDHLAQVYEVGPHGYRTGDLARVDAAGRLWLVGRARDLLKVGGHRVAAKEIEDAIAEHPAVIECAVIGVPDELLGDRLRAFVVADDGSGLDAAALGAFLKDRLPGYKIPSQIDLRAAPQSVT